MTARDKRIDEDIKKLKILRDNNPDLVKSIKVAGNPVSAIRLTLGVPTAQDDSYPKRVRNESTIHIELPARYPLDQPKVSVVEPTWNPNIYRSGLLCLGQKWIPTEGLDLLVIRVMRLLAFDDLILNTDSPANYEALKWYENARARYRSSFPTLDLERLRKPQSPPPKLSWKNIK